MTVLSLDDMQIQQTIENAYQLQIHQHGPTSLTKYQKGWCDYIYVNFKNKQINKAKCGLLVWCSKMQALSIYDYCIRQFNGLNPTIKMLEMAMSSWLITDYLSVNQFIK